MNAKKSTFIVFAALIITSFFSFKEFYNSNSDGFKSFKKIVRANSSFNKSENIINDESGIREMLKWQFMRLRNPRTNRIPANMRKKELAFAKTLPNVNVKQLKKGTKIYSAAGWTSRGPNNQGGRTKAVAVDVSNENIMLAGAAEGGVWRSTDKGKTWNETTNPDAVQNINCLVQDTRKGKTNTWYYGTGELMDNIYPGGNGLYGGLLGNGIFKSTDDGQTWKPLQSTQSNSPNQFNNPFQIVWKVAIDTTNYSQDIVYAACLNGLYRSTDGGNSWNVVLKNTYGFFCDVTVDNAGGVYASIDDFNNSGIYYAADGIHFKNISPGFFPNVISRSVITTAPSNKNILYVFANTPGTGQAGAPSSGNNDYSSLWKYNASTKQWTNMSNKLPSWSGNVGGISTQDGYDMLIKVKPDNENFVIIGGTNIYRTTNGFSTQLDSTDWIGGYSIKNDISDYPGNHPDQHAGVFLPSNPKVFISGNDGGISITDDITASSVKWHFLNEGYVTSQFWSVSMDKAIKGNPFLVGGMQDNGTMIDTTDLPKSDWMTIGSGDGTTNAVADSVTSIYFSSQNGYILRATKSNQWTQVTPKGASGFLFVTPYILDPDNSNVMFLAAGKKLWRNSNLTQIPLYQQNPATKNWNSFSDSAKSSITALGMSKAAPNLIYIGTSDGFVYKINSANDPGSAKFNVVMDSTIAPNAYISSITVDQNDGNKVLVAFSNYNVLSIFYSSDGGASWDTVAGNLEQYPDGSGNGPSVRCVKILSVNGSNIYLAGTSTGLYMTTTLNGMNTTWIQQAPKAIGNVIVETMAVRSKDGTVVAGTFGKGVFSSKITETGIDDKVSSPYQYTLSQNYPNPFNPSTTITYSIPESGDVSLKVYDSIGKLVKTLVNGYENQGEHKVIFSADNLGMASGVYFYRLKVDNFMKTKKMLLLK